MLVHSAFTDVKKTHCFAIKLSFSLLKKDVFIFNKFCVCVCVLTILTRFVILCFGTNSVTITHSCVSGA